MPIMSDTHTAELAAVRDLFLGRGLEGAELEQRATQALSIEYWRSLQPSLTVTGPTAPALAACEALSPHREAGLLDGYEREGYMRFDGLVPPELTAQMKAGVHTLLSNDWPAVFSWMYDEFWRVPRMSAFAAVCRQILGPGFRQTPYIWTHVVAGQKGSGGWPPHVDNTGPDDRVTLWVPLSEASLEIGCMYVVPKDTVPAAVMAEFHSRTSFTTSEVDALLRGARPLIAPPGTGLSWDARLIHWGSSRLASGEPRISFSMEFIGATGDPSVVSRSVPTEPEALPSFEDRLRIVAHNIRVFHGRELRVSRYLPLAVRLLEHLGGA